MQSIDSGERARLSAAEFTAMLRDAGALPRGAVTSLEITKRVRTEVSHLCFATATYSDDAPQLPRNVMVKWPVEGGPAPEGGLPELTFYRKLAPALASPPIVRCVATATAPTDKQW